MRPPAGRRIADASSTRVGCLKFSTRSADTRSMGSGENTPGDEGARVRFIIGLILGGVGLMLLSFFGG